MRVKTMTDRPRISIVGPGRVGTALGVLAARAGWTVAAVGGRDPAKTRAAAAAIGTNVRAGDPIDAAAAGELVLLTVRDDAIEAVCRQLVAARALRDEPIVAHCCGALGSEVLSAARDECGCSIASCHPLQTFPTVEAAIERLAGAYFFCEGDERALTVLEALVDDLGSKCVRISSGDRKTLHHAGAVMACNYLAALVDAGMALMESAGVEREVSLAALGPLVRATVENVLAMGPEQALTGPLARGDVETVERHLRAMGGLGDSEIEAFYRAAGRWTLELARRKGNIDRSAAQALSELLAGSTEE